MKDTTKTCHIKKHGILWILDISKTILDEVENPIVNCPECNNDIIIWDGRIDYHLETDETYNVQYICSRCQCVFSFNRLDE